VAPQNGESIRANAGCTAFIDHMQTLPDKFPFGTDCLDGFGIGVNVDPIDRGGAGLHAALLVRDARIADRACAVVVNLELTQAGTSMVGNAPLRKIFKAARGWNVNPIRVFAMQWRAC